MAEAILRAEAAKRGLRIRAESAGTVAGKAVNPQAIDALREDGTPTEGLFPKQLTQEMADRADRIISMGCGVDADACPARFLLTDDWGLDDPAGQPIDKVREIRDAIRTHVVELLDAVEEEA